MCYTHEGRVVKLLTFMQAYLLFLLHFYVENIILLQPTLSNKHSQI